MKTTPLAEPALAAVREGKTQILPEEWVKTYEHWLVNIQDWCISRQLWWGHQIPAYHCQDCGEVTVSREKPSSCQHCGKSTLVQDPDVLDTWFSSALWPFSTLGWPEQTPELKRFYPASDMETGYDILFFWVTRMMMMGIHFMGEAPFKRILLHGMVVDETGDKMGKLKGNTIDPLDLIHGSTFDTVVKKALPDAPVEEALTKFRKAYPSTAQMGQGFSAYGADALRFTLCSYSPQARRIALSPARIDGYRKFCNKIYNATRFALQYLAEQAPLNAVPAPQLLVNRWILSRLGAAVEASTQGIDEFRLDDGSGALYHFFWDELCDWYVEMTKTVFQSGSAEERAETSATLLHVLSSALRALHPYMPFITEELWQKLPKPSSAPASVSLTTYPTRSEGPLDADAERDFALIMRVVSAARSARSEHEVHPAAEVPLEFRAASAEQRRLLTREAAFIEALAGANGAPVVTTPGGERPRGSLVSMAGEVEVLVGLRGLVEAKKELERID
ncbi:MAG TPA: class I tRNA ligase family protein, partial [Polyangiales bacterium]|nr:class I tRNA ligase family protein [Polyangiales bacterium]